MNGTPSEASAPVIAVSPSCMPSSSTTSTVGVGEPTRTLDFCALLPSCASATCFAGSTTVTSSAAPSLGGAQVKATSLRE